MFSLLKGEYCFHKTRPNRVRIHIHSSFLYKSLTSKAVYPTHPDAIDQTYNELGSKGTTLAEFHSEEAIRPAIPKSKQDGFYIGIETFPGAGTRTIRITESDTSV